MIRGSYSSLLDEDLLTCSSSALSFLDSCHPVHAVVTSLTKALWPRSGVASSPVQASSVLLDKFFVCAVRSTHSASLRGRYSLQQTTVTLSFRSLPLIVRVITVLLREHVSVAQHVAFLCNFLIITTRNKSTRSQKPPSWVSEVVEARASAYKIF